MKVLLLGAFGYVGTAVRDELVGRGHDVVAVVRQRSAEKLATGPKAVRTVVGDAFDPAGLTEVVRPEAVDAVVHAAAVGDWDADHRLVDALASALVERGSNHPGRSPSPALVYTSGVWMLGPSADEASTESSQVNPIPLVAGREKVEDTVLSRPEVRGVVVRPGVVHGRRGGIPEMLVEWAREDGVGRFVASRDGSAVTWPMIHVDDLAALIVRAVESPSTRGILHGVAEPAVPVVDLAAAAAVAAGVSEGARAWAFDSAARMLGEPFTEALALNQRVDALAARAIGWRPAKLGAVEELRARPLPTRRGAEPEVAGPFPHAQVSQTAPLDLQEELARRALSLEGVREDRSLVSVPGARAFVLEPALAKGPSAAFQAATEFAHLHPSHDGSLHLTLPPALAARVYTAGWGQPHPESGTPLVFGPRDEDELETVSAALRASYAYARGWTTTQRAA